MTLVKNLQFVRYFLTHEIDIDPSLAANLLNFQVLVKSGEPDKAYVENNTVVVTDPSSLTRFLFNVLYALIKQHVLHGYQQDKLALGLLFACKDYTYSNYASENTRPANPPVIIDLDKIDVPAIIIRNLAEPLMGKIKKLPVMYMPSRFVDACEIQVDAQKFSQRFDMPFRSVPAHDYPFILANSHLHNQAAQESHLLYLVLEHTYGQPRTAKFIKNMLLNEDLNLVSHLLLCLKTLNGDPIYIMDFLKFFKTNITLNRDEEDLAAQVRERGIRADRFLASKIKTAQSPNYTPEVYKQWHQWAAIVGLIEKQLAPMRGSLWPATENLKPIEDQHRQMETEKARKKGKTQLNFEELLELARDWYGHKTCLPGQLAETMLRENRVWK